MGYRRLQKRGQVCEEKKMDIEKWISISTANGFASRMLKVVSATTPIAPVRLVSNSYEAYELSITIC